MECIYRDEAGRKTSLCLRVPERLVLCKVDDVPDCQHRVPGHKAKTERQNCPVCGKKHSSYKAMLRCRLLKEYQEISLQEVELRGSRSSPFPDIGNAIASLNLWPRIREIIISRDGHRCQKCGDSVAGRASWLVEVHHVIPRVEGGSDHPANLMTLCAECHRHDTQALILSRMPSNEEEWKEWQLNRKFRGGRDLLRNLMDEP